MSLRIVIPCKGLDAGKRRLAAHLSQPARARLNAWLLTHTIRVMRTAIAREEQVMVVSPDVAALGLARLHGAQGVVEPIGCGLNAGLALSRPFGAVATVEGLLVVPVDLPLLDITIAAELVAFARAAVSDYSIGIVPDRAAEGTNALAVPIRASFEFMFGPNSMRMHYAAAARAGLGVRRMNFSTLAFDLDEPGDFTAWAARADFPPQLADLGFTRTAD
jgi:2-phospho-L-lactate/phosphoenolpyruvate guanylyltransferase